jgi:hypothetical protein
VATLVRPLDDESWMATTGSGEALTVHVPDWMREFCLPGRKVASEDHDGARWADHIGSNGIPDAPGHGFDAPPDGHEPQPAELPVTIGVTQISALPDRR